MICPIRKIALGDRNRILSDWRNVFTHDTRLSIAPWTYQMTMGPCVEKIVDTSDILIAHDSEEVGLIYGWISYHDDVLYMVFVRRDFRRFGIGSSLIDAAFGNPLPKLKFVTKTKDMRKIPRLIEKWKLTTYCPWLLKG